jgi:hypothetical protein
MKATDAVRLSVVATSRNDNHGGSLTQRMQHFVDGFVAQCKRHGLRAELILVEWNPPPERPPLRDALAWPADPGPCDIRIITVPPEVHRAFSHSGEIRLFQMIAKNVGLRRARGEFLLATNIDILFSDGAIRFLRDRLCQGTVYLADRVDVPAAVPDSGDFGRVLRFCGERAFRINTGGLIFVRHEGGWRFRDVLKGAVAAPLAYVLSVLEGCLALAAKIICKPGWAFHQLLKQGCMETARLAFLGTVRVLLRVRMPFTNSCGDFTAMSRSDWLRLRGYPEWHIFSYHLDSVLIYQAAGSDMRVRRLGPRARIYHIDHDGGYTAEGAAAMFERLSARGIPFLSDRELTRIVYEDIMSKSDLGLAAEFNSPGWGLDGASLPEWTYPVGNSPGPR